MDLGKATLKFSKYFRFASFPWPQSAVQRIKKVTVFPFWKTSLLAALFGQGFP